jgi:hypothetical protein
METHFGKPFKEIASFPSRYHQQATIRSFKCNFERCGAQEVGRVPESVLAGTMGHQARLHIEDLKRGSITPDGAETIIGIIAKATADAARTGSKRTTWEFDA